MREIASIGAPKSVVDARFHIILTDADSVFYDHTTNHSHEGQYQRDDFDAANLRMETKRRMISLDSIKHTYLECLSECRALVPAKRWKIQPQRIHTHAQHRNYGIATINGEILIYQGFIGTSAYTKLRETMLHELAHLCVGLQHGHNRYFKRIERLFIGDIDHDLIKQDEEELRHAIPYKLRLIAYTEDSEIHDLGGAHRKSKRWTEYVATKTRYDLYRGVKVLRYEYIPFKQRTNSNLIRD